MRDSQAPPVTGIKAGLSEIGSEIFIRLWSNDERGNKPVAVSWETRNGIVYMIADLILANDGRLAGEIRDALVAQFSSPVKAITAARRIQWCVTAFADARAESRAAVGIAIYDQAGSFHVTLGASSTVPTNLLDYTQPESIILSEKAVLQLGSFPGLPLRKVSLRDSDRTANGDLWELLWAPARNSARSVDRIDRSGTAITAADAMGASAKEAESEAPASLPSEESAGRDRVFPPDTYAGTGGTPARGEVAQPGSPAAIGQDAYSARIPAGDMDLDESLPSEGSHWFWPLTIGIALALMLVFSILIFQPKVRVHQPPPASDLAPPENPEIHTPEATPTPTQPANSAEPQNPPAEGKAIKKNPPEPTPSSVDGFSRSEIPLLLRRAEQDAGSGNYAAARREYNIILRLDPGNAAAKQGIHRLELSAGESQE